MKLVKFIGDKIIGRAFSSNEKPKLEEVGKFIPVKLIGNYQPGQLIFHKIFGYRGMVLFSWRSRVYENEEPIKSATLPKTSKVIKGKEKIFYQVLTDLRDRNRIRIKLEPVIFMVNRTTTNKFKINGVRGLDYVSHDDILPYTSDSKLPIHHELFSEFFRHSTQSPKDSPFEVQKSLEQWRDVNLNWLGLSDVFRETTENLRISVMPFFVGFRPTRSNSVFWWRYSVRLENFGETVLQLRERHWRLYSVSGSLESSRGRGVIGQEPVLDKVQPAFQYSSYISLNAPRGHMWGTFNMQRPNGKILQCSIPLITLNSVKADVAALA